MVISSFSPAENNLIVLITVIKISKAWLDKGERERVGEGWEGSGEHSFVKEDTPRSLVTFFFHFVVREKMVGFHVSSGMIKYYLTFRLFAIA